MIDMSWKIMLLSEVNREKYSPQIDALIDKLYEYETPEGGWPYPFDKKAKPADFVSYNAVLALAEAGRRPETDEHLAIAVKAMLAAQRPEGSWEGDPVYQGFNTPFRATQFAVMALSTLYPGNTKAKNWNAAYPPPATTLATTISLCCCSSSTNIGIWLPSPCCARFAKWWRTAINRLRAKPQHAHWDTWLIRAPSKF